MADLGTPSANPKQFNNGQNPNKIHVLGFFCPTKSTKNH
jgi:hypothetical protein